MSFFCFVLMFQFFRKLHAMNTLCETSNKELLRTSTIPAQPGGSENIFPTSPDWDKNKLDLFEAATTNPKISGVKTACRKLFNSPSTSHISLGRISTGILKDKNDG